MITRRAFGQALGAAVVPALPTTALAATATRTKHTTAVFDDIDAMMSLDLEIIESSAARAYELLRLARETQNPSIRDGYLFDMRCSIHNIVASVDFVRLAIEPQRLKSAAEREAFEARRQATSKGS